MSLNGSHYAPSEAIDVLAERQSAALLHPG